MKNFSLLFITLLFITLHTQAQTEFGLNGLGRVVVESDKLDGNLLKNDSTTTNKGVGGYFLFDLGTNLKVNNNLKASAILRVKNEYGGFFGEGTSFEFRQIMINGKIGKYVSYDIGDMYLSLTPYTLHSFDEMYNTYEAEIFKQRRQIVQYENFMHKNDWRMQGVHASSSFQFNKGIKELSVRAFGTRTNPTNDVDVPDRVFVGSRVGVVQSDLLSVGLTYTGILDIPIEQGAFIYKNNVITGDVKLSIDKEQFGVSLDGEFGNSSYNYTQILLDTTVSYKDYFMDVKAGFLFKPAKLKLIAGYKNVGPEFSSPGAQTRRINVEQTPELFPVLPNRGREQMLFDRFTGERLFNQSISPILYSYIPKYNLLEPYGPATPNRTGFSVSVVTDTSAKKVNAEIKADFFNEIVGEGIIDTRSFTSIKGGALVNVDKFIGINRGIALNGGLKYEKSSRSGLAPVDFTSTIIDAGLAVEVVKRIDLLMGTKMLTAKGTEYTSTRNEFNSLDQLPLYQTNSADNIYSVGGRVRFSKNSFFTVNYNYSGVKNKDNSSLNYNIKQLFFNYTIIL